MNKVLNIDIAGQVFSLEESAYDTLKTYLEKLRQQLSHDDSSREILQDIELRIAELLFAFSAGNKAISIEQVEEIIEQVGFIDSEDDESGAVRRSFLDQQNKILGGVCSGLAIRFQVPAFILRLIFLLLVPVFGVGIILYLIFWVSLESNTGRNAALAALGKARTAKQLALYEEKPEQSGISQFFYTLQRVIFLPISLLGVLLTVLGNHFVSRRRTYFAIMKNIAAAILLFFSFGLIALLYQFGQLAWFPTFINLLLSVALVYVAVLILAFFARYIYLSNPAFEIRRELVLGALVPIAMLGLGVLYLVNATLYREQDVVQRDYSIAGNSIKLEFVETSDLSIFHNHPRIRVRPRPAGNSTLGVIITYTGAGSSSANALENLQQSNWVYTFNNDTLRLDNFYTLQEGALNRGQEISVMLELPEGVMLETPRSLSIRSTAGLYNYAFNFRDNEGGSYLAQGSYLHEFDEAYRNRLSDNERRVLQDKFCSEFFVNENWSCNSNTRMPVAANRSFDRAFQQDIEAVEELRGYFQTNRSLFVSNLAELDSLVENLSIDFPVMSDFQEYVNHLMEVKSI